MDYTEEQFNFFSNIMTSYAELRVAWERLDETEESSNQYSNNASYNCNVLINIERFRNQLQGLKMQDQKQIRKEICLSELIRKEICLSELEEKCRSNLNRIDQPGNPGRKSQTK